MKQVKINLKAFHCEVEKDDLVFYGFRGDGKISQKVVISFNHPEFWFKILAKMSVKYIKEKRTNLYKMLTEIKNGIYE